MGLTVSMSSTEGVGGDLGQSKGAQADVSPSVIHHHLLLGPSLLFLLRFLHSASFCHPSLPVPHRAQELRVRPPRDISGEKFSLRSLPQVCPSSSYCVPGSCSLLRFPAGTLPVLSVSLIRRHFSLQDKSLIY